MYDPRWARIDMEMRVREAQEQAERRRLLREARTVLPRRTALARRTVLAQQALTGAARLARALGSVLVDWGERLQTYSRPLVGEPVDEIPCAEGACTAGASR